MFSLNDVNIFDGAKWHISIGRERNDEIKGVNSVYSSSYFIRAGRQCFGELAEYKSASVYFSEEGDVGRVQEGAGGAWQNMDAKWECFRFLPLSWISKPRPCRC